MAGVGFISEGSAGLVVSHLPCRVGGRAGGGVCIRSSRAESWVRRQSQTLLVDLKKQTASQSPSSTSSAALKMKKSLPTFFCIKGQTYCARC